MTETQGLALAEVSLEPLSELQESSQEAFLLAEASLWPYGASVVVIGDLVF